jgi:hypothetical protein
MTLPTTKSFKIGYGETQSQNSQLGAFTQFSLSDSASKFNASQEDTLQSFRQDLISSLRNVVLNSHKNTDILLENLKKPSKPQISHVTQEDAPALERVRRQNAEEMHRCSIRGAEIFEMISRASMSYTESTTKALEIVNSICDQLQSFPVKRKAEDAPENLKKVCINRSVS